MIIIYISSKSLQIKLIFSHLKLWIAAARHNFKWLKIYISWLSALRVKSLQLGMEWLFTQQQLEMFSHKKKQI